MAGQFQQRTQKEKFEYHRAGEKRILAKLTGHTMTQAEKDLRSAGYMAHARESMRKYIWANATDAERTAMKNLRNDKSKREQLWAVEKVIKERAKKEREAAQEAATKNKNKKGA